MYTLKDRSTFTETDITEESFNEIESSADYFDGNIGGIGYTVSRIICEDISTEDADEFEWVLRLIEIDGTWYDVPAGQADFIDAELGFNAYQG